MPENYFINPNLDNPNNPNVGNPNGTVPSFSPEPENKFAPPPPNIFIRTSETDLNKAQESEKTPFGQASPSSFNPTSTPSPSIDNPSFSQEPSPFINPQGPNFSQTPFETGPSLGNSPSDLATFTQPQSAPKTNKLIPIIIIITTVILGAILGYFILFPKLLSKKEVSMATTTTTLNESTTTTTTVLPPSPFPLISPPYEKQSIALTIPGQIIVSSFKNAITQQTAAPQTFTILIPKFKDYILSSEEIISALIPKLPENLKTITNGRKTLVYAYYGNVNPSLGLIVDIGQNQVDFAKTEFANWEKSEILSNLSNFWVIKPPTRTLSKTFKSETINGAEIRYLPYKGKEAALGYAFFNNYLIISSSLESINSAVNHLQGAREPIYP
ncbi:MAG: hypothetical protein ACPLW7_04765 [Minisyncoccia bacterium]